MIPRVPRASYFERAQRLRRPRFRHSRNSNDPRAFCMRTFRWLTKVESRRRASARPRSSDTLPFEQASGPSAELSTDTERYFEHRTTPCLVLCSSRTGDPRPRLRGHRISFKFARRSADVPFLFAQLLGTTLPTNHPKLGHPQKFITRRRRNFLHQVLAHLLT